MSTPKRRTFKDLKSKSALKRTLFAKSSIVTEQPENNKRPKFDCRVKLCNLTISELRAFNWQQYPPTSLLRDNTPEDILLMLICQFSYQTICTLCKAMKSVPPKFPKRNEYILNIVNCYDNTGVSDANIDLLIDVLKH